MLFAVVMAVGAVGCGGTQEEAENTVAVEMQAELQAYDAVMTADTAAEAGMFTIANGVVVSGQEKWDAFMAGEADSVGKICPKKKTAHLCSS